MAGKKMCYIGTLIAVQPSSSSPAVVVSSGSKNRGRTSFETEKTTKILYKDYGGGCSSKMTQSHKAGKFVDKRNGNQAFKQEVNYKSSCKVNDKIKGCTTEFETQVKFKKVTTYNNKPNKSYYAPKSSSSSNYKGIKCDKYY